MRDVFSKSAANFAKSGDALNLYNNLGNNYAGAVRRYKQKGEHAPQ
jgi:hypothetical protein